MSMFLFIAEEEDNPGPIARQSDSDLTLLLEYFSAFISGRATFFPHPGLPQGYYVGPEFSRVWFYFSLSKLKTNKQTILYPLPVVPKGGLTTIGSVLKALPWGHHHTHVEGVWGQQIHLHSREFLSYLS